MKKPKVAILASGNGSNFQVLAEKFKNSELAGELVLLFSDQPKAFVLERAKKMQVPYYTFTVREFENKQAYEKALLELLKKFNVDLVILAGYMKIVGTELLNNFPNRIINIHPSLLPNFPGLHGIEDAYNAGVKITGVTVHYIDNGIDTGPVIAQKEVEVSSDDTLDTLEAKIHLAEHQLYPEIIKKILADL